MADGDPKQHAGDGRAHDVTARELEALGDLERNPADGPMQDRRKLGKAAPERPRKRQPDDTADQQGIETDNAIERPQKGQPGQPGGKVN